MKSLPSSLREKQRYLRFKVHTEKEKELGEAVKAIWDAALDFLGSKDTSRANLWIIGNKFDEEIQEGVVRVNKDSIKDFRAALTLVSSIHGEPAFIEIKDVSGTLKSLEERE